MIDSAAEIERSLAVQSALRGEAAVIEAIARQMARVLVGGGTVWAFGNGGSAADAEHLVAELVGRYGKTRRPFAAVALSANTTLLTALANDLGFSSVYARQVQALARPGDLVVGISTSGRSTNVVEGLAVARGIGAATVALTGSQGDDLVPVSDLVLRVDSTETPRIQEGHRLAIHCICAGVERFLTADSPPDLALE